MLLKSSHSAFASELSFTQTGLAALCIITLPISLFFSVCTRLPLRCFRQNRGTVLPNPGIVVFSCDSSVGLHRMPVNASDPDPLVDNPANVKSFTLHNVFRNANITTGPGGVRAALSTSNFLASMATGEAHFDILYPGDATLFPRALLHFEINLGTKTASFISALNSKNPGTMIAGASLFRTPKAVVATALHSEAKVLEKIAKSLSTNLVALQLANKEFCIPGKNVSLGVFQTGDLMP